MLGVKSGSLGESYKLLSAVGFNSPIPNQNSISALPTKNKMEGGPEMKIKCDGCGVLFEKEIKFINYAKKHGLRLCCNRKCAQSSRITSIKCRCDNCGDEIIKHKHDYDVAKHHFCSLRCSTQYNNKLRDRELLERIANKIRKPPEFSACLECGIKIPKRTSNGKLRKFCSTKCAAESQKVPMTIPQRLEQSERKIDKYLGYVRIYAPEHPEANTRGFCYEHRIIAEQQIGRRLAHNEVVHHKNRIRWDNRPSNLEVMDRIEHGKLNRVR